MKAAALLAALMAATAAVPASADPGTVETIRYERREVAFCLVCSSFLLTVSSDGTGTLTIDRPANVPDVTARFRVTPAQFAEFRRRLAPYRPRGERVVEKEKGSGMWRSEDSTVDIQWSEGGPPGHLVYYLGWDFERLAAMRDAIAHAPEALAISELPHPDDPTFH